MMTASVFMPVYEYNLLTVFFFNSDQRAMKDVKRER